MTWMTHKRVATLEALIFAVLFVVYGFFALVFFLDWGVAATDEAVLMGKRVAAAMLGAAVLLWFGVT